MPHPSLILVLMPLVRDYDQVKKAIQRFNSDLRRTSQDPAARALMKRLAYNRAWYFAPELDLVAPSKFIGYAGMTAARYVGGGDLDGRQTEPILQQWFRPLKPGSPEEALVREKVEALLARHHKALNRAVRFCAPIGWKAPGKELTPGERSADVGPGRRTIHATITRGDSLFVAECDHLAVVTQGRTVDETLENLKEAIALHLDGEDLRAFGLLPDPVVLVTMELLPWAA